jgi:hypothetical protein
LLVCGLINVYCCTYFALCSTLSFSTLQDTLVLDHHGIFCVKRTDFYKFFELGLATKFQVNFNVFQMSVARIDLMLTLKVQSYGVKCHLTFNSIALDRSRTVTHTSLCQGHNACNTALIQT